MNNFDYYAFRIEAATKKILEEVQFYEQFKYYTIDPNTDTDNDPEKQMENLLYLKYINYLKNRIGFSRGNYQTFRYDGFGNRHEIKKLDISTYGKEMDTYVFDKPWAKLKEFHKIMKIKEFVNELPYTSEKLTNKKIDANREMLIKGLSEGLRTKRFLKGKSEITYNQEKMKIEDISSVDFNKKTGLYEIDWDL